MDSKHFHKAFHTGLCSVLALSLVGCGTISLRGDKISSSSGQRMGAVQADEGPVYQASDDEISIETTDETIVQTWSQSTSHEEREELRKVSESIHSIPVEMNKEVKKWLNYFTKKDRARFQRFLNRGAQYREIVENVLEENGLPAELYYLALIESGYQNHATSIASAVGVWQFIPGTGRRYGLEINRYIDERRDPIRATEAAVRYLRDLHNVFGSWHLAMAGYNAGEFRVVRGIFKAGTRDFWKLVKLKALPRETRNYVPKFLAAVEIGSNIEKYGFEIPQSQKYPDLQAVQIPGSLSLGTIASVSGVSVAELKKVNPHLRREVTPPGHKSYEIWVPVPFTEHIERSLPMLAKKAKESRSRKTRQVASSATHRVRRGENLSLIASRYGLSLGQLKRLNNLRGSRIYPGMRLRTRSQSYHAGNSKYYKVRRGDNLSTIARRFGVSVSHLKQLNGLRSDRIFVGSRLKVAGSTIGYYRVRRGDNLSRIADKFGMTVRELKKLNGLRSNRIYAGARFKVRKGSNGTVQVTRYRVRRGDNLTAIARRFGTSIRNIQRLNSLRGQRIYAGQVLKVSQN